MKNAIKWFSYLCVFVCSGNTINAQNRDNLLYRLTSDSLLKDFPKKDTIYGELQENAWELSFIGESQIGIKKMDLYLPPHPLAKDAKNVITDFRKEHNLDSYKSYSAVNYILNRAEKERIIIINESHAQPMHRTFSTSLLRGLYKRGYKYLALEALSEDSLLTINKYPVIGSGYYTRDPQFGNMIREALQIGYTLVAYEYDGKNSDKREEEQALNIKKILDKDSTAKIFVHCGFGHGTEDSSFSKKLMGGLVNEYTKINPFTINQESWTEHSKIDYEDPYFICLQAAKETSVFINSRGELLKGHEYSGYDIDIYHPRTKFINGRADWLTLNGSRNYFFIPKEKLNLISYPLLALAYCSNEDSSIAVPADIMELKSATDKKAFVLKPGFYKIIVRNNKKEEATFNIEVKSHK